MVPHCMVREDFSVSSPTVQGSLHTVTCPKKCIMGNQQLEDGKTAVGMPPVVTQEK